MLGRFRTIFSIIVLLLSIVAFSGLFYPVQFMDIQMAPLLQRLFLYPEVIVIFLFIFIGVGTIFSAGFTARFFVL